MYASRVFRVSIVSLASLVIAGHAGAARAASTLSDRLLITDTAGGATIFDQSIPEDAAAEPTLTFAGGPAPVSPPPIPIASAIGIPGVAILILTEPAGEPPDPTEPPLVLPGPNGNVLVSDVLVSTLPIAGIPGFVSLLSDGDPELQNIIPILATMPGLHFMEETGGLQDVTSILNGPPTSGQFQIFVQSDVPEPGMLVLSGLGLALLSLATRRRWIA
jgi:PEP-CTERM motif-containing protein